MTQVSQGSTPSASPSPAANAAPNASSSVVDRTERTGSPGMVLVLALVLVGTAASFSFLSPEDAGRLTLGLLALLAIIGVIGLFTIDGGDGLGPEGPGLGGLADHVVGELLTRRGRRAGSDQHRHGQGHRANESESQAWHVNTPTYRRDACRESPPAPGGFQGSRGTGGGRGIGRAVALRLA